VKLAFLGAIIWALSLGSSQAAERQLRVVTSFLPAYCFAANVAGNAAKVENLVPGTVTLHDFQLSPGDLRKLSAADLIVVNGLGMEGFLDKAIAISGKDLASKIVRLSAGLDSEIIKSSGNDHSPNPHIWLDPRLALHAVTNVLEALENRDPAHRTNYRENAAIYGEQLRRLDAALEARLLSVKEVPFVTYHDAFPYFVRRYGLTLAGVVERVPEVAPSPKELSRLLAAIRELKVRALFAEPGGTPRLARQIAADAHLTLAELDPIESGVIEPGAYEKAMLRNAATLLKVLKP
jgi:zinc/manganese transport system substrate-binding protein